MGKLWGRTSIMLLCATQFSVYGMEQHNTLVPASSIDKTRWGAKATVYGACAIGSAMLLATGLYDFATNNTPETAASTRFATIGAALVGLKCFGFGAYKAFRELMAGHSDREALIQEIMIRLSSQQVGSLRTPEALSSSSFPQNSMAVDQQDPIAQPIGINSSARFTPERLKHYCCNAAECF